MRQSRISKKAGSAAPTESLGKVQPSALKAGSLILYVVLLACLVAGAFLIGRFTARPSLAPATSLVADNATLAHPGPWGNLEYVRIFISPPQELLSVRSAETNTHWFFKDYSRASLVKLFDSLGVSSGQRDQLLNPAAIETATNGLVLAPGHDLIFSLAPQARQQLHQVLAQYPENTLHRNPFFFPANSFDEHFAESGVAPETVALVKKLCCNYKNCLYFSDLPAVLDVTPAYEERVRLIRALSRRSTLLVKLHVTPDSDVSELATYWGKACWSKDVTPMLESLARVPGGARVDLIEMLPPLPSALLYTFPLPSTTSMWVKGNEDCHWSSFNFFRDPPNPRFSDPAFVSERLRLDYFPVSSDPRYGDVVLFLKPSGEIVHSAVYLADDIVFTKNGGHYLQPWMLSTVSDLADTYSFQTLPDEQLKVAYYRSKYY